MEKHSNIKFVMGRDPGNCVLCSPSALLSLLVYFMAAQQKSFILCAFKRNTGLKWLHHAPQRPLPIASHLGKRLMCLHSQPVDAAGLARLLADFPVQALSLLLTAEVT